jgi:hypothetical protein
MKQPSELRKVRIIQEIQLIRYYSGITKRAISYSKYFKSTEAKILIFK